MSTLNEMYLEESGMAKKPKEGYFVSKKKATIGIIVSAVVSIFIIFITRYVSKKELSCSHTNLSLNSLNSECSNFYCKNPSKLNGKN